VGPSALTVLQLVPALNAGGAERSTLEIGAALVAAGHRSIVVSAGGRLVPELEAQGSRHVTLDLSRKSPLTLARIPTLRRLLRDAAPDIVHARSRLPAWMAYLAMTGPGAPRAHFVTTVHGLNSPGHYSAVLLRGERIICVSGTVREFVLAHYPRVDRARIAVIPRGVDPAAFPFGHQATPEARGALEREFPQLAGRVLLTLPARGTRLKGHHDALELLARLRAEREFDCALLLLGVDEPGRERYVAELRRLADSLGVADRVAYSAPRGDVREIFAMSALVLQLSRQAEAFGRTVVEALSLGVPVLGYARGGVGELLRELFPAGLVPPDDPAALAAGAARLLKQRPAMAPVTRYHLADMQDATLALYRDVASRAERRRMPRA
jgi:glycosyltransferase involved in cell wall biosynthesis